MVLALGPQRFAIGQGGGGQQPLPMPVSVASVVGFGDSITAGAAATVDANRWINIVSTALGAGTPLNQGIPGTVLQNSADSSGSARTDNGRNRYISALLGSNKREMVFLAYGFNDGRYTGAPATFNVTAYETDYREVILGLLGAGYPADRICIVSPYWISDTGLITGSAGFTGQTRAGFEAFVSVARSLALQYGLYYADTYAAIRDNGGASLIDTDFIHPLNSGHAVIAQAVLAATRVPVDLPTYTEFYYDTFTDTDGTPITLHSGEKNAVYALVSPGDNGFIRSNRYSNENFTSGVYRSIFAAPQADYFVEGEFDVLSVLAGDNVAVSGRNSDSAQTLYWFGYSRTSGGWRLFKTVAGTSTQIGATVPATFDNGTKTIRLEMQGTTLRGIVDGVTVITQTDSAISAAGYPGIRYAIVQTSTTGIKLNKIKAGIL